MIPIDARELIAKDQQYRNPFAANNFAQSNLRPPKFAEIPDSEDSESLYMQYDPLNRSEGEIGGDIYLQGLGKGFKQPDPGMAKSSKTNKLGQTQGYMDNVPRDGVKDPIYESGEGPIVHNQKNRPGNAGVY